MTSDDRTDADEVPLTGGLMTPGVVRVGDTVRRPVGPHSPFVHDLLRHLDGRGYPGSPRFLGLDAQGREMLTYREGWVPQNLEYRSWGDDQVVGAARLVRALHDATAGSPLSADAEVVCHGDLSPCNVVFVDRIPRYLIDFDSARPGTRREDLAYMAWMWLVGVEDPAESPPLDARLARMRLLLDAYGLGHRARFAEAILERQRAVRAAMVGRGSNPWWVDAEIRFVEDHAARITAAAE